MKNILFFILMIANTCFSSFVNGEETKLEILRLNMKKEPENMDPRKDGDIYSSQMHFLFFEGLVKRYPDGSIQLAQAESYEVSEDHLTYTFHLRDTVWSNNTPVTAYDFEQSWKDILDPQLPSLNASLFSPIKNANAARRGLIPLDEVGIKAIDAKTLVVSLEKPVPYLFELLSYHAFFPVNKENDRKNPNWADGTGPNFLCNGPFVMEKWDHEHQIIAASNPLYRKTQDLHPEKIVFNIVENDVLTLQMFEQGLVDMIGDDLSGIPLEEIPALEKKWTISRQPSNSTFLISINTEKAPLHHPKIRKALGLAINRQELIASAGSGIKKTGGTSVAYQASLAALNMIPPGLKKDRYRAFFQDNDIDQAKILLEEGMTELGIGKEAFEPLVLNYPHRSYDAKESAQVIQKQWLDALGIFIKIKSLDFRSAKIVEGEYSMYLMCWDPVYNDPMSILERFKYKDQAINITNWENPQYIQLLDQSFYEQGDERILTLEKAEEIFINEMPFIPLYYQDYVYMVNPNLDYKIPLWGDRMLLSNSPAMSIRQVIRLSPVIFFHSII